MSRRKFTDEDEREICRRYELGTSVSPLSTTFGCSEKMIKKILRKNGVKVRGEEEAQS